MLHETYHDVSLGFYLKLIECNELVQNNFDIATFICDVAYVTVSCYNGQLEHPMGICRWLMIGAVAEPTVRQMGKVSRKVI